MEVPIIKVSSILLLLLLTTTAHAQRIDYGEGPWGRLDFIRTELSPEKCPDTKSLQNKIFRTCPPVAGYQLLYSGDESRPDVIVVGPDRKVHVINYWDLTGDSFLSLEKEVAWQIATNRAGKVTPLSLEFQANVKPNPFWRFGGPYTVVAKLTPEVCVVGRVPSGPYAAQDLPSVQGNAPYNKCIPLENIGRKDWLGVVYGLDREGRYEEAKATLKEILSPSTRTVAYIDIARAEATAGKKEGARTTLLLGWDDLLNQKDVTSFMDEYGRENQESSKHDDMVRMLGAMAELGFDDEASDKLNLISSAQLPEVLLFIAKAQGSPKNIGGRGDRDAANATFMKAIQLALSHPDPAKADYQLQEIVEGQLQCGLINEARQTILLIKNPEARKAAEYTFASRAPH